MYPHLNKSSFLNLMARYIAYWLISTRNNCQKASRLATVTLSIASLLLAGSTVVHAQEELVGFTSNGGPQGKGTLFSVKTTGANYSIIKSFADWGKSPKGSLIKGNDGNFYGLTPDGGTYGDLYGFGTIFRVTPKGEVKALHHFNNTTDGGNPTGSLVKGADGNFYGLTSGGSATTYGTIFKITPSGTFTVIRNFEYTTGAKPNGHLTLGKDGNFYGLTYNGGTYGTGVVFKLTPSGTYSVLHHFNKPTDGGNSYGSLTQGKDGSFYGMTYSGGTYGYGTIFKISSTGTFKVLRHLQTADGIYPEGNNLTSATDGNLYGIIRQGGNLGNGTIFKMSTTGNFTVIRHLDYRQDGGRSRGSLVQGADGALYGTTTSGGTTGGYGTIFKITTNGTLTVLRHLDLANDGGAPMGDLYRNSDGNFYGLTSTGGKNFDGTIFKITSTGTYTVLNTFNGASQGNTPSGNIILAKDGAYYGTNWGGGTYQYGTIFKICGGVTTVLRSFNKSTDGGSPLAGLVQGTDGNFYGTTSTGGNFNNGTLFKITAKGLYTVLHHFNSYIDGSTPAASLVQGKDGSFYGTAKYSGPKGGGTIFKITTAGAFKVLWGFTSATDGSEPGGNLVQGADGNLYGTAPLGGMFGYGTIFKISTTGTFQVIKHLNSIADGSTPMGGLMVGKDGNLYGTTSSGGSSSYEGAIFRITPAGNYKVLKRLNGLTDGKTPLDNLVQASDGNFYGMTSKGGKNNVGTLFRITTGGNYTVLRHFNLATDGGTPLGSLMVQKPNPLVANAQSTTTVEDTPKIITLTGSGGEPLTFTIKMPPKNGTLSGSGATRTYKPKANFTGKDTFTFTVSVGCLVSAPATVTITVSPVNDAPVLATISDKTINVGSTLNFTATATDPDAGQTKLFSLVGAPAGATINATTGVFNWKPTAPGSSNFKIKVQDNGTPALSDEQALTVTVTNTPSTVRLNTGGAAVATSLGNFAADAYFSGATGISATTAAIEGTTQDALYQDNRRAATNGGSFSYNIPVTNGNYLVKLHFAETFHAAAGLRKFNVSSEGTAWLMNYDIVAAAGSSNKAVIVSKNIAVADGVLNVNFVSVVDKACVSAIEVVPAGSANSFVTETSARTNALVVSNLYPNPAVNILKITLNETVTVFTGAITDSRGYTIKSLNEPVQANAVEVNVESLQPGLYQLHVQTTAGAQIYRFVKR